jgi:ATP-binding cassette, subfamily A (ABC1), member 3
MASTAFEDLARQVKTLTKKNLVLLVTRHWISTLFQALLIPVAVYALILNIDNYKERTDKSVGQGIPRPIRSIQESIPETQQLVIIKPHRAAADIDRVIKTISVPLSPDKVAVLDGIESLQNRCEPNIRGVSGCYSIVVFHDSPLTAGANQTWNYTLQFDQAREGQSFDVHRGDNAIQLYQLPVQLAIDNAITNSTTIPDQYIYTWKQEEVPADVFKRLWFADALITTYIIAFFLGALPGIYHAVGFVTRERADGVSHLIDAMGGGAAARVVASVLALSTVQLLGWVLAGVCK